MRTVRFRAVDSSMQCWCPESYALGWNSIWLVARRAVSLKQHEAASASVR